MKNLEALRDRLTSINHPAHELASFLLTHSNSPEYLAGALASMSEAVALDRAAEAEFASRLFALIEEAHAPENMGPAASE
jgi:hypothetical protein